MDLQKKTHQVDEQQRTRIPNFDIDFLAELRCAASVFAEHSPTAIVDRKYFLALPKIKKNYQWLLLIVIQFVVNVVVVVMLLLLSKLMLVSFGTFPSR